MPVTLLGIGVSRGLAIGQARLLYHGQPEITEYVLPGHLIPEEVHRFEQAVEAARLQLRAIRERIPRETPEEIASFIDTHLLMLDDSTLIQNTVDVIRERGCNAEWALKLQEDMLVQVFDEMDDPYLKTRRDDIQHVVRRIQQLLVDAGAQEEVQEGHVDGRHGDGRIYVTEDISPGDLVLLHQRGAAGVVIEHGTAMSHVAILARNLGLPMVVGARRASQFVQDNETLVLDGARGIVTAGLDKAGLAYYRDRQRAERKARAQLSDLKDVPSATRDGVPVKLFANIELAEDLNVLHRIGAAGVGLYRTEFLYLNRDTPPGEGEQVQVYRQVVRRLKGRPLTLRTLDLGLDKWPGDGGAPGPNPALGLRAVRFCLQDPELFLTQFRAALRAASAGPIRLLVPMLSTLDEVRQVRELFEQAKAQLSKGRRRYASDVTLGAMIEVPSAALCADRFADYLDFFSIGTNDLIQYTLAADRMDDRVNYLFDPTDLAVLRLIRSVLEAGRQAGLPVAMCGEMAGDPLFTRLLLGLGLTEFSVPPTSLLEVKRVITGSDLGRLRPQVEALFQLRDPDERAAAIDALNVRD